MIKLFIAGHGKKKNGVLDGGAIAFNGVSEHEYYSKHLFPMMKKLTDDKNLVLFSDYNVYDYGNIVNLALQYGKDTQVVECHFDSSTNASAKGGHLIISSSYKPDKHDLRLVKMLEDTIGIRYNYNHAGVRGLSGRSDLSNVNRCKNGKISYRLIELGFGSNKTDINYMMNNLELIATELLKSFDIKLKEKTVDNKLFRVQVGAFVNKNNAIKLKDELIKKGYKDAFISEK